VPDNRRSVQRVVNKPKKKRKSLFDDDLDGFIASDDDVDYDSLPVSALSPSQGQDGSAFNSLTNMILLSGPSGCGKSCSVYACANELGWEVFEVWPGIGKRGSKDLFTYVGDVINNRVVEGRGEEKQVVILLEEVDLLWSEDKAFWEGVVDLASKSKRPIVMTCNGASLLSVQVDKYRSKYRSYTRAFRHAAYSNRPSLRAPGTRNCCPFPSVGSFKRGSPCSPIFTRGPLRSKKPRSLLQAS
jgi:hypothetical protein